MDATDLLVAASFFVVAVLYSTVGHAGASGYLAVMGLAGLAPEVMRPTALLLNIAVSLASVAGAVIAWYLLAQALEWLPYALAIAAASFLYVAVADLIPGLHRRVDAKTSLQQVALIAVGIVVIATTHGLAH